jgi:hypothetical protein
MVDGIALEDIDTVFGIPPSLSGQIKCLDVPSQEAVKAYRARAGTKLVTLAYP